MLQKNIKTYTEFTNKYFLRKMQSTSKVNSLNCYATLAGADLVRLDRRRQTRTYTPLFCTCWHSWRVGPQAAVAAVVRP